MSSGRSHAVGYQHFFDIRVALKLSSPEDWITAVDFCSPTRHIRTLVKRRRAYDMIIVVQSSSADDKVLGPWQYF